VNASATVFGFGSLWVPIYASPHGWLVRIDTATNRISSRIAVGESPDSVAIVGGSVWVANSDGDASRTYTGQNTLSRVDPGTNRVVETTKVEVGGPIAGGLGAVWVMTHEPGNGNGTLHKVNAGNGRVDRAFPLSGIPEVACDALWTIDSIAGPNVPAATIVSVIDPTSGRRLGRWPLEAGGATLAEGPAGKCVAIWSPADTTVGTAIGEVSVDGVSRISPIIAARIVVVDGAFWSVTGDGLVQMVDEDGSPISPATALPAETLEGGAWQFLHAGGAYWVVGASAMFRVQLAG